MYDEPASPSEEQASGAIPAAQPGASPSHLDTEQDAASTAFQPSGSLPLFPSATGQEHEPFYTIDSSLGGDELDAASQAAPFQLSGAIAPSPAPPQKVATPAGTAPPVRSGGRRWHWLLIAGLATLIVALLLSGAMLAFATPTTPLATTGRVSSGKASVRGPSPSPDVAPSPGPTSPANVSSWPLQQLPAGWTQAGLSKADAAYADRTGVTFTDREMSLDARNMGTRVAHGGTLTAVTFLLTPAARTRFAHNDVRVINNLLFDRLTSEQMIQAVVDEMPQLVRFQAQGQQQLAWVEVRFHLWQERKDPAHPGGRIEGLETDPASGQPRLHRMSVLLLRVAPGTQGPNAPMGGTGWLVSNYGLDLAGQTVVDLIEPA